MIEAVNMPNTKGTTMQIPRILAPLSPAYRLAQRKREYERYLRAQGFSRSEALKAVRERFNDHEKPRR